MELKVFCSSCKSSLGSLSPFLSPLLLLSLWCNDHMTRYFKVIGLYYTVWWDKAQFTKNLFTRRGWLTRHMGVTDLLQSWWSLTKLYLLGNITVMPETHQSKGNLAADRFVSRTLSGFSRNYRQVAYYSHHSLILPCCPEQWGEVQHCHYHPYSHQQGSNPANFNAHCFTTVGLRSDQHS